MTGDGAELSVILNERPTLASLLDWWAQRHPDRVAHVVPGIGELTFAQWRDRGRVAAAGLQARGIGRGSRVGLAFSRAAVLDFAGCLDAVHRLGAAAVLLPVDDTDEELHRLLESYPLDCLVVPAATTRSADRVGCPVVHAEDLRHRAGDPVTEPVAEPDDLASVVFTSGTTAVPKGVAMCHRDLLHDTDGRQERLVTGEITGTLLHTFPLSVPVGQWAVHAPLLRGLRTVVMVDFQPRVFAELVDTYQVTETAMVPTIAAALRDLPAEHRPLAESLRAVTVGSARPPQAALDAVVELFPRAEMVIDYSSTESGWAGTTVRLDDDFTLGCVGTPRGEARVRVLDDDGHEVARGEIGIVELGLPPEVPARYYVNDPIATAETFRGRWVRTADRGYLDERGRLHLLGRISDVVHVGGRKVSCHEVEQVLESLGGVREAAVFPVEDPVLGEELAAAVVADGVTEKTVRTHARERLSGHKVPTRIAVLPRLPRTRTGKVRKTELPDLLRALPEEEPADRPSDVGALLRELGADTLGIAELRGEQSLFELGVTSLDVIRIHGRMVESLGAEFDVGFLFLPLPLDDVTRQIEAVLHSDTGYSLRR